MQNTTSVVKKEKESLFALSNTLSQLQKSRKHIARFHLFFRKGNSSALLS